MTRRGSVPITLHAPTDLGAPPQHVPGLASGSWDRVDGLRCSARGVIHREHRPVPAGGAVIKRLLVIPGPDHLDLLAPGLAGSRPPLAFKVRGRKEWRDVHADGYPVWPPTAGVRDGDMPQRALVLAADGAEVWQGIGALARAPDVEKWVDDKTLALDAHYLLRTAVERILRDDDSTLVRAGLTRLEQVAALVGGTVEVIR
jgi:hypothetical protein